MMSRPRPSLPVGHALRALALAAAALGVASSPAAPAAPVVVAQLGGVPTSPGFKMNLGHNDGSPAEHVESGDKPASAGKDAKEGKPAAAAKAHEGKGEESPHGEKKTESAKHGESKPAATEAKGVEDPNASADPMDVLREKLAAKLGAKPASDGKFVMQVSNRGESGENIISSVRPSAAAMAAGKRAAARKAGQAASASGDPELNANIAAHGGGALLPTHWDYAGAGGPDAWGKLKPEYSQCSSGSRQSPIDIRDGISVDLDPIKFDYHPSAFSVIDNGHTVQVNVEAGNTITITGRRFELQQFHFHRPSEERINGRQFDMVAHLVHRDQDGKLAVIAVLLDRGSAQAVVQMVWNNLPLEKGQEARAASKLDLAQLLPQDKRYYTYMGSLTTPPCSEGVLWMVMKQPVPISADQLAIFSHLYPMNARPIQQADGRLIKQSN